MVPMVAIIINISCCYCDELAAKSMQSPDRNGPTCAPLAMQISSAPNPLLGPKSTDRPARQRIGRGSAESSNSSSNNNNMASKCFGAHCDLLRPVVVVVSLTKGGD